MPAAVQCSWSYGQLVHGQSVTLGTGPSCGLGLVWAVFPERWCTRPVTNGDAFERLALWSPWQIGRTPYSESAETWLRCYLSNYHWDSSIGALSRARSTIFTEPLPGELPPLLGCNPKRSSNSSPDGDIPYSPLLQATMLPPTAWLGAVALTVLFGELSCHTSQVLQGCEKLSASITATAAKWPSMAPYRGASGLAIRSTQYLGLLRVLEPSQRGAPLRVPPC